MMQLMSVKEDGALIPDEHGALYQTQTELMRDMREHPDKFIGQKWTLHERRPVFEVKESRLFNVSITKEK